MDNRVPVRIADARRLPTIASVLPTAGNELTVPLELADERRGLVGRGATNKEDATDWLVHALVARERELVSCLSP